MDLNKKIASYNDNGHVAMPGKRTAYILAQKVQRNYIMNDKKYCSSGFDDEQAILNVWTELKKQK
jgi:hypothetical protein